VRWQRKAMPRKKDKPAEDGRDHARQICTSTNRLPDVRTFLRACVNHVTEAAGPRAAAR